MKNNTFFLCLMLLTFIFIQYSTYSQVPTHWNSAATSGGENSFPLNQPAGKGCQWLVRAGEYNLPTPAPSGKVIHSLSLRLTSNTTYQLPPGTYTQFRIILQQSTITDLPVGSWYTAGNPDTVFYRASYNCPGGSNIWLPFVLDHDYPYDPTKSLIIQVEQCGWTATGGFSLVHVTLAGNRRVFSVGGCPIQPYNLAQTNCVVSGIELINVFPLNFPNYLYYKFECNTPGVYINNCAYEWGGVGNFHVPYSPLLVTTGGQYDSCINGSGNSSGAVITGWNCNFGQSSWTISMWLSIPTETDTQSYYLFGDAGSGGFRCFHNGPAGHNNMMLKGPFNDILVTGIGPNPTVVTIVNDSVQHLLRVYKNGVLAVTSNQTINIPAGTGFKVAGYSNQPTIFGKMDEFRVWRRALATSEVAAYWNSDPGGLCGCIMGISKNIYTKPISYFLEQNYPNPFNPVTNIKFGLPKSSHVQLVVYNIAGKEIEVLVNEFLNAGNYSTDFDASELSSGVYIYSLEADGFTESKKWSLLGEQLAGHSCPAKTSNNYIINRQEYLFYTI